MLMDHPFSYEIIYSSRRTIAVQVTRDGRVVVRAPRRCSRAYIEAFVSKNEAWVLKHLEKARQQEEARKAAAPLEHPPLSKQPRRWNTLLCLYRTGPGISGWPGTSPSGSRRPAGAAAAAKAT